MSKVFAENLSRYRALAGMTQSDIAKSAGITRAAVANYESGRTEPSFEVLCKVSDVLGVDITDLVVEHQHFPEMLRRVMVTDEEAYVLDAYRNADGIYQNVALEILRSHPKGEQ